MTAASYTTVEPESKPTTSLVLLEVKARIFGCAGSGIVQRGVNGIGASESDEVNVLRSSARPETMMPTEA